MSILAILQRFLSSGRKWGRLSPSEEQAARPDIHIVSLPSSGATSALAKALRAGRITDGET